MDNKNNWKKDDPTESQAKMILTILSVLEFDNLPKLETKGQAAKFIDTYKDKAYDIINKPTDKQKNFIKLLESKLGVKFKGKTKKEASEFITENKRWLNL